MIDDRRAADQLSKPFAALVDRITHEGSVIDGRLLKIDHFLNHRVDTAFMQQLGTELAARLAVFAPDLILTAESSGIPPAMAAAAALNLPFVYARKYSQPPAAPVYTRLVPSPTRGGAAQLTIAARALPAGARVVIIDDFLSHGRTAAALAEMTAEAQAVPVGAGFVVEKCFEQGRTVLAARGIPIAVLAQVLDLSSGRPRLAEQPWLGGPLRPAASNGAEGA
jgi:xanthine phosphoribosyltransferase